MPKSNNNKKVYPFLTHSFFFDFTTFKEFPSIKRKNLSLNVEVTETGRQHAHDTQRREATLVRRRNEVSWSSKRNVLLTDKRTFTDITSKKHKPTTG